MRTSCAEFAPLEIERAEDLKTVINRAAHNREAVVIDPDDRGVTEAMPIDLVSPDEDTNVLVRYQRHYATKA